MQRNVLSSNRHPIVTWCSFPDQIVQGVAFMREVEHHSLEAFLPVNFNTNPQQQQGVLIQPTYR